MTPLRQQVLELVKTRAYQYREEPFTLASGQQSHDFIDGKLAVHDGPALTIAAEAILEWSGTEFDAVGGLTMGADALAHAVAIVSGSQWFSVRKEPKNRGTNRWVEGARLGEGTRVLLVDDVITTGGSILQAFEQVVEVGAEVVAVATLVDRGEVARKEFDRRGVRYDGLVTYRDLGIDPVGPALAASG